MIRNKLETVLFTLFIAILPACGGGGNNTGPMPAPCSDGEDNDADGLVDFPEDPGCVGDNDETEDSLPSAQCQDGRDNDSDGKTDYPVDPGCFAPQADGEEDDCPDGPSCPQCGDGIDNDNSGAMDYPGDPGCISASDDNEHLSNPVACGATMTVRQLPPDGLVMGELGAGSTSTIVSPCGGGGGSPAIAFELHLNQNKVIEVSTDDALTTADTVIDIRGADCMQMSAHIACNDDISATNEKSKVTAPLTAGDYFIIIEGHDSSAQGMFAMQVKQFAGQGSACSAPSDCGPGLVCRNALGATSMTCEKPQCGDGLDDDQAGDGADYPMDPGCTSLTDNDETDDCPNGPNCPECSDGDDNDNDGKTDYPMDTTCLAAGDSSESCTTTDGVTLITTAATMGTTMGANDDVRPPAGGSPLCSTTGTHTAPDRTYRLDLPAMSSLRIESDSNYDGTLVLLDSTCGGTPIACRDSELIDLGAQPAGAYFVVVDGYATGSGAYTLNVSGKIANGGSCEGALAQAGAISCNTGFTCKGMPGSRTCQPGLCGDKIDNDSDGKIDFPNDPGCDSLGDDTEANPATPPVCSNSANDDGDALTDWPADYGCTSAAGGNETFCVGEVDAPAVVTTNPITGTTVGLANNFSAVMGTCTTGTSPMTMGPDKAFSLQVPVFLDSLTIDLSNSGANMSFDTVVSLRDANCAAEIACDDDSGEPGLQSKLVVNNVAPGGYAIIVDGYGSVGTADSFTMTVKGIASAGQACNTPLFSGGANAVLKCPTSCVANVCQ